MKRCAQCGGLMPDDITRCIRCGHDSGGKLSHADPSVAAPRPPASQDLYIRSCCQIVFQWIRYDLFVEYDQDNGLKSARYLRSFHEDGEDRNCLVLFEIPAAAKVQYPHPCPPKAQH